MSKTMSNSKILLGILGAAAAGVVVGLLIAPEKGKDLRKNISKTASDWMDELTSWAGRGKAYAREIGNEMMADADELKSKSEEGVNSIKENLARRKS
jgi:gas vesicle protein